MCVNSKSNYLIFLESSPIENIIISKEIWKLNGKMKISAVRRREQGGRPFLRHANKYMNSGKAVNISEG